MKLVRVYSLLVVLIIFSFTVCTVTACKALPGSSQETVVSSGAYVVRLLENYAIVEPDYLGPLSPFLQDEMVQAAAEASGCRVAASEYIDKMMLAAELDCEPGSHRVPPQWMVNKRRPTPWVTPAPIVVVETVKSSATVATVDSGGMGDAVAMVPAPPTAAAATRAAEIAMVDLPPPPVTCVAASAAPTAIAAASVPRPADDATWDESEPYLGNLWRNHTPIPHDELNLRRSQQPSLDKANVSVGFGTPNTLPSPPASVWRGD